MTYEYQQYLAHYGVKGQKHGRRRYQNEDGSLTPEGREHYGVGDGHRDVPESDTWKKKESKYLSDEELNRRNNRMQREAQYRTNIDNRHPVKKEAVTIAKKILLYSAVGIATAMMTSNYKKIASKGSKYIHKFVDKPIKNVARKGVSLAKQAPKLAKQGARSAQIMASKARSNSMTRRHMKWLV